MMDRKNDPERRERGFDAEYGDARAYMQEIIDRVEARMRADAEYRERRRRLVRRVMTLGLRT